MSTMVKRGVREFLFHKKTTDKQNLGEGGGAAKVKRGEKGITDEETAWAKVWGQDTVWQVRRDYEQFDISRVGRYTGCRRRGRVLWIRLRGLPLSREPLKVLEESHVHLGHSGGQRSGE